MSNKCNKRKAFLGALVGGLIGAGASIGSAAYASSRNRKAQEESFNNQQESLTRQAQLKELSNLNNAINNQSYVDEVKSKVTLKNGGKIKNLNKVNINRKFACGGRKRKQWGGEDTSNLVSSLTDAVGTLGSTLVTKPNITNIPESPIVEEYNRKEYRKPIYGNDDIIYNNRLQLSRLGTKKKRKC